MVLPFVIAGLGTLAIGALIANAEPSSKKRLQSLLDELQELENQNKIALKNLEHENHKMEMEVAKIKLQTQLLRAKNEFELEVLNQLKIQAANKELQKQLAK